MCRILRKTFFRETTVSATKNEFQDYMMKITITAKQQKVGVSDTILLWFHSRTYSKRYIITYYGIASPTKSQIKYNSIFTSCDFT